MATKATRSPRTYGELRKALAAAGDPWQPDPTKSDDEPLPVYPTGGDGVYEPDSRAIGEGDVDRLLAKGTLPSDPDILAEWREEGLLPPDEGTEGPRPHKSGRKQATTPAPDSGG